LELHFAEFDDRTNASWAVYKQALEGQGKDYEVFNYSGVHHGFHNNSTPRYDADNVGLAWELTVAFLVKSWGD
jgi:carboxymethylenebutenolidase